MCKNNDKTALTAVHAAARNYLNSLIVQCVEGMKQRANKTDLHEWHTLCLTQYISVAMGYKEAGIITRDEMLAWARQMKLSCESLYTESASCDDCGATMPHDMISDLVAPNDGGGVSLCPRCLAAGTDPRARDNASVEAGWDGCGDFEDAPAFMHGHPTELD